jgi:hypothetical protein
LVVTPSTSNSSPQKRDDQQQGEEAMGDRSAERALLRTFRIHMDPLLVISGVGEQVDLFLGDLAVVGGSKVGTGHGEQFVEIDDEIGHRCLLLVMDI